MVAGTRAAVFAPVADLGLVAVFDDGDDLLDEPRAPYPHAREVLMLRSAGQPCALLIGGFARTAEAQLLVDSGWAQDDRGHADRRSGRALRGSRPPVTTTRSAPAAAADQRPADARPPSPRPGRRWPPGRPVLVQVPRRGYLPGLACDPLPARGAQCRHCRGPLALGGRHGRARLPLVRRRRGALTLRRLRIATGSGR